MGEIQGIPPVTGSASDSWEDLFGLIFHYFLAFDFDDYRYTVRNIASKVSAARVHSYCPIKRSCTPILQRDVLGVSSFGRTDLFRGTRFVIAVWVFGGKCEATRMSHFEAVAAV